MTTPKMRAQAPLTPEQIRAIMLSRRHTPRHALRYRTAATALIIASAAALLLLVR